MMTDPISDLLTRIRNGLMVKHDSVNVPFSKVKENILVIMKEEGFVSGYKVGEIKGKKTIRVFLKYYDDYNSVIRGLKRVSKPSCRIYAAKDEIPKVMNGQGEAILSTNKGVLAGKSCRKLGLGGEVLCNLW